MTEIVTLPNGARVDLDTLPAAEQLEHRLALGCRVAWPGAPSLDGTYSLEAVPSLDGSATQGFPDLAGAGHIFTRTQLARLAVALMTYRYALALVGKARGAGHDVPWPGQPLTLDA